MAALKWYVFLYICIVPYIELTCSIAEVVLYSLSLPCKPSVGQLCRLWPSQRGLQESYNYSVNEIQWTCRMSTYFKLILCKSSCLEKWLPNIVQISLTKRQRCVRIFSHFGLLDWAPIPYCDKAHTACGTCMQLLSLCAECEITSFVP